MFSFTSGPIRKSFRTIPTLQTERLTLRKILPRDEDDMYEYSRDPETSRYLLWEPHSSRNYTRAHIRYLQSRYRSASFFDWALTLKDSGKMIGTCGFTEIYEKKKLAEIGYVISPKYHRQGFAPEAVEKVLEHGFLTLGLEGVFARFMEDNIASRKILERLGFCWDESKKESIVKRGKKQSILTFYLSRNTFLEKNKKTEE